MIKCSPLQAFTNLQKGDFVRVHMDIAKNTFKKSYKAQWSKDVYIIWQKNYLSSTFSYESYMLKTRDGNNIQSYYKHNELLKVATQTNLRWTLMKGQTTATMRCLTRRHICANCINSSKNRQRQMNRSKKPRNCSSLNIDWILPAKLVKVAKAEVPLTKK